MNLGFSSEPALWIAIVDAALVAAATFGLPVSPEQKAAINAVLIAIGGVLIRSRVTPSG